MVERTMFCPFGEKIQDYAVESTLLGKGGFSNVYKARCLKTSTTVAIKMIEKKVMQSEGLANRVRQEVAIHSRLKHPSVLELLTFFEDNNYVHLVLEYCQYGELLKYVQSRGVLSETQARNIMKQLVDGFLYLHSHKILHRDVKLSNILLTSDMQIKIADFGLATQLNGIDERHVTMCGTPNYVSPEVASHKTHGLETDLWGLGCLFYTMVVGHPPFETDTVKNTLSRVVSMDYHIPSHLSENAKDLINRLLQKNPRDRMRLDEIAKHPFMKSSSSSSSSSLPPSFPEGQFMDSGLDTLTASSSSNNIYSSSIMYSNRHKNNQFHSLDGRIRTSSSSSRQQHHPPVYVMGCRQPLTSTRLHDSRLEGWLFQEEEGEEEGKRKGEEGRKCPNVNCSRCSQHSRSHSAPPPRCLEPAGVFNTSRLKATKHRNKNVVLAISQSGEVLVEFLDKGNAAFGREETRELCTISPNGKRMRIFKRKGGECLDLTRPDASLNCEQPSLLPKEYWRRYEYAARFVEMVKSKTPKVTVYTKEAKCVVMENGPDPDFEIHFYRGEKISKSRTGLKFTNSNGLVSMLSDTGQFSDPQSRNYYNYYKKCYEHCMAMEEKLSECNDNDVCSVFPAILGRKPPCDNVLSGR